MDTSSSPILLLDVNFGNNIQRVMFHEDDDPREFADKIAAENGKIYFFNFLDLDDRLRDKFLALLLEQLEDETEA